MQIRIPDHELIFSFSRAGGPGGQNVNKVETKVSLQFDFLRSSAFSEAEKGRLSSSPLIQRVIDAEGRILLSSQVHRSQARNRDEVVKKLYSLLLSALVRRKRRIATSKTRASERRRLESKKRRSSIKAERGGRNSRKP